MKYLAEISDSYEKWCVSYLTRTGESISLIQTQILKVFCRDISLIKPSKVTRKSKRDNSEGVILFTKLITSIYEDRKLSTSLPDFFESYVDIIKT